MELILELFVSQIEEFKSSRDPEIYCVTCVTPLYAF